MPWFLTPHGPHFAVEPGTVDEYERRDYTAMTTQQAADYFAGVAFPDPPSFATEAEVLPLVTSAVTAGTGALPAALRAAFDAWGGGGGAGVPAGAQAVFATEDAAVADAHPEYVWLILEPAGGGTPADTTAPSVPTGLAVTPGDGQVTLSWTASTDAVGVTGYRVYRDGTLIASPTGTTYPDTGRTNGTQYSYTVAAADAAGNVSAQTSAVTATPAATPPAGGVAIATDDFTGTAAADNLAGRTTTTGGKVWTKNFGFNAGINANRALLVGATGPSRVVATIDAGTPDVDVTATNGTGAATQAAGETGVVVRCTAGATPTYVQLTAYGTTGYRLDYMDQAAGTGTALVSVFAPAPVPGDVLRLKAQGTTYTAYINGTQVAQVTSTLADETATGVGITGKGSSFDVFLDDFAVVSA